MSSKSYERQKSYYYSVLIIVLYWVVYFICHYVLYHTTSLGQISPLALASYFKTVYNKLLLPPFGLQRCSVFKYPAFIKSTTALWTVLFDRFNSSAIVFIAGKH